MDRLVTRSKSAGHGFDAHFVLHRASILLRTMFVIFTSSLSKNLPSHLDLCRTQTRLNLLSVPTVLAASAFQISEFVGLPEAQLALAQAAIYVACAPKSNASSSAIGSAIGDVQNEKTVAVPKHLKDSHYAAAKKMGFGAEYKYPHSFEGGFVVQEYLPGSIKKKYYKPTERGYEKNIRGYLQKLEILIKDSKAKGIENNGRAEQGNG